MEKNGKLYNFYENFNFKKIISFFSEELFSEISDFIILKKII